MTILLLLATLAPQADLSDWFALRANTVDSTGVKAHDIRSGVVIRYESWLGVDHANPGKLRRSSRLVKRRSGKKGSYSWELFELSDPSSDTKRFVQDLGLLLTEGTWEAALVRAYSPPAGCDLEIQYFLRRAKDAYVVFTAVPCNAEQRSRVSSFLDAFMSGVSPHEVALREAFGPTGTVSEADRAWLATSPDVADVLDRLGAPDDVWPCYPEGFTLLYDDVERTSGRRIAVDFSRMRSVTRVRVLDPTRSAP